jgi:hypothetical protein
MTVRRHPELRGLGYGLGKAPLVARQVHSPRALAISLAVMTSVKQIKSHPLLRNATFNQAHYDRARAQASSLIEAAADMAGTTTLEKADVQQLLLGGLNVLGNAANMLGMVAYEQGEGWRVHEAQLIATIEPLAQRLNQVAAEAQRSGTLRGLGLIMIALVVGILAYYFGTQDATVEAMRQVCLESPDSAACGDLIDATGDFNPLKPAAEAGGKLVWWIGIGAAVLLGGYIIYALGPAAGGAARTVRQRSQGRGMRGGPRRVYDLDGPSSYDLEV